MFPISRLMSLCAALLLAVWLASCGGGNDSDIVADAHQETTRGGIFPVVPAAPAGLAVTYSMRAFHFSWAPVAGASHYVVREDPDGVGGPLPYSPISNNILAPNFVRNMEALHLRLNARYVVRACNVAGCSADSATITPNLTSAIGYFKASNPDSSDSFGRALALSADGQTLAVGAPIERSNATGVNGNQLDNSASGAGAVYVFRRIDGTWVQQAYLKASNAEATDLFGFSVALSADGTTLAVGALEEGSAAQGINGDQTDNSADAAGAVYVFGYIVNDNGQYWLQQAYIKASNTDGFDRFGAALALSNSGDVLAVGATQESSASSGVDGNAGDNSLPSAGAAYVFHRTAGVWSQQAYVKASNPGVSDYFGSALALSGDGLTLAVAASNEGSNATGINGNQVNNAAPGAGAVYVYAFAAGAWSQQAYVKASNAGAGNVFGSSLALSADGNTLAVGAEYEDSNATGIGGNQANNSAAGAGAAYVFTRVAGVWSQQAYVKASNTEAGDHFGNSVALSADGNMLVVGAVWEDSGASGMNGNQNSNVVGNAGAAYVFTRNAGVWAQRSYVKSRANGVNDHFGAALALSADGLTLVIGAISEDGGNSGIGGNPGDNSLSDAGAVYFY